MRESTCLNNTKQVVESMGITTSLTKMASSHPALKSVETISLLARLLKRRCSTTWLRRIKMISEVLGWTNKLDKNHEKTNLFLSSILKRVTLIKLFLLSLRKKCATSKLKCELSRFLKLATSSLHVMAKKVLVVWLIGRKIFHLPQKESFPIWLLIHMLFRLEWQLVIWLNASWARLLLWMVMKVTQLHSRTKLWITLVHNSINLVTRGMVMR
jgi:hypothetical protein